MTGAVDSALQPPRGRDKEVGAGGLRPLAPTSLTHFRAELPGERGRESTRLRLIACVDPKLVRTEHLYPLDETLEDALLGLRLRVVVKLGKVCEILRDLAGADSRVTRGPRGRLFGIEALRLGLPVGNVAVAGQAFGDFLPPSSDADKGQLVGISTDRLSSIDTPRRARSTGPRDRMQRMVG